jgi:hypothetical protein
VFGLRRVVFINRDDLDMLGFKAGEWVDMAVWPTASSAAPTLPAGGLRHPARLRRRLLPGDQSAGAAAKRGRRRHTPTSKSIPVLLQPAKGGNHALRVLCFRSRVRLRH